MDLPPTNDERTPQFLRLYAQVQRRLYGFILTLVPRWSDADDVMQETMSTMWRKFSTFQPGTDFAAWAFAIARFEALSHYKRRKAGGLHFEDVLLDSLAHKASQVSEELPDRVEILRNCLQKLSEPDRKLLTLRYEPGNTIKSVAEHVGRPIQGLYKAMARIHDALLRCVQRSMPEGSGT